MRLLKNILMLLVVFTLSLSKTTASHIIGMDFFYTHLGGLNYQVTLVVYGDCSSATMGLLPVATPEVEVYNGFSLYQTIYLPVVAPANGVEITPVCPAQLNNTFCSSPPGTIQGVKKFTYSGNITLSGSSANWRFRFTNVLAPATQTSGQHVAGRSPNISNIGANTFTVLEATLNNAGYVNSSPTYTTIPTPFFSVNKPANYNPGTVDPNGDALVFALVPGLDVGGTVSYNPGYSPTQPIAVVPASLSFANTTGQLNFTPNQVQSSLVVYKVSEYRNNVLVGTSMREMTYVVLNNGNNPPGGAVTITSGGVAVSPTALNACNSAGTVNFTISPTDADGNTINVQWSGIPPGAVFNMTGNNTTAPQLSFSWNVTGVAPGSYTFFLTYTDNGCPLSSKQTQAYTITILPSPDVTFNLVSPATCTKKAVFTVSHTTMGAWKVRYYQGATLVDSAISAIPTVTDSLAPGTYTFRISNSSMCIKDTVITIVNPTTTKINLAIDRPTCNSFSDGTVVATGYNSTAPYQYAIDAGSYSSSNTFSNLAAGTYVIHVKDAPGCIKDTTLVLTDSLKMTGTATVTNVACNNEATGVINLAATGGHGIYNYSLNSAPAVPSGNFTALMAATYILHAEDQQGCFFDTVISVTQPFQLVNTVTPVNIDCAGNATGSISIATTGGVSPYVYSLNGAPYVPVANFNNLLAGTYFVTLKDSNDCIKKDTIKLTEPAKLLIKSINLLHPLCHDSSNGVIIINVAGGVPPFTYAANNQPYISFNHIVRLREGSYVVHIKDNNGCIKDSTVQLVQPSKLSVEVERLKALCHPLATGHVAVEAAGGTAPYVYALDNTFYTIQKAYRLLPSGPHVVRVKDDNNCILDTTIFIEDSLKIESGLALKNIDCNGVAGGEITVAPVSGFPPYRVTLDNGWYERKFAFTNLPARSYRVTIKDTMGCTFDSTVQLTEPPKMVVDTLVTHSNCYTATGTGSVRLDVSGGVKPYAYLWSTGDTTSQLAAVKKGMYYVRITDFNDCRDSLVAAIEYTDCCTPLMANAFTPNGDGRNDIFRVVAKGDMQLKAFAVFNRYGQRIFFTENINDGWDGRFNGAPLDAGTYFYMVKAACGANGEHAVDLKGDITIVK